MNKEEKTKKKSKETISGITLIALVITIIVLLILVGVSIATLTGQNGILTRANDAKVKTDETGAREKVRIAVGGSIGENGFNSEEFKAEIGKVNGKITSKDKEFPINVTVDGYNFEVSEKGEIKETGKQSSTDEGQPKAIEEVKAGDWIIYPSAKKEITCRVLYDTAYNENNGTDYGIQIVSEESVEDVILGHGDTNVSRGEGCSESEDNVIGRTCTDCYWAERSYSSLTNTLNSKSKEFINKDYSDENGARCVGSNKEKDIDNINLYNYGCEDSVTTENYLFGNQIFNEIIEDLQCKNDWKQLNTIGSVGSDYWICTRVEAYGPFSGYDKEYGAWIGGSIPKFEIIFSGDDNHYGYTCIYGLRPVFTLKSGLNVIGNGTKENPYRLEK